MSKSNPSVTLRRSRIGVAAALAITMGACGENPSLGEGSADFEERDDAAPLAQSGPAVASPTSLKLRKRQVEERRAARAALQIDPARLSALGTELRLGKRDTLRPVSAEALEKGGSSVRCAHYHDGLRVIGSSVVVHTDKAGSARIATNSIRPVIRIPTSPTLKPERAVAAVMADPKRLPEREAPEVELSILPLTQKVVKATGLPPDPNDRELNADQLEDVTVGHQLVYVVDTDEEDPAAADPIRRMRYLVDANTGEIIRQRSRQNHVAATNDGLSMWDYPDSSTTFSNQLVLDTSWVYPPFEFGAYRWVMDDTVKNFEVQDHDSDWWDGANNLFSGSTEWGDGLPFAGDSGATSKHRQTSMVDAKAALQFTWQMFDRVFLRQGVDDDYYPVNAHVHYGTTWDDAMYDPNDGNIYVGDGPNGSGKRTSLDTVAHEFGHGFDDFTAGLRECNNGEACGLSEANADIIGVMTNYYVYNLGALNDLNFLPFGKHSINTGTRFVDYWIGISTGRNFRNPKYPFYYPSIGNANEHDALGPMAAAFFFLTRGASVNTTSDSFSYFMPYGTQGVGIGSAAAIWYEAMAHRFTDATTYSTADDALILAAKDKFGTGTPEPMEVEKLRDAMAAANFATASSNYVMPPSYTESEPNDSQSQINWVPKPSDATAPTGKPVRKEVFGYAGTGQTDWYQVWVPNGYALKIALLPADGYDHDISTVREGGTVIEVGESMNGGSAADAVWIPYVQGASSGHKSYDVQIMGYNSGSNGAYRLFFDWIPFCSSAAAGIETLGDTKNTMAGCAGTVTFANRATLCGQGTHVCSAQEWNARRGSSVPGHNYWTDDALKFSGTSSSCSASLTTGSSCGSGTTPMRVCAPTQNDPEGNACNWTGCGLDSTSNMYFGGCATNTTAGTLCCFD